MLQKNFLSSLLSKCRGISLCLPTKIKCGTEHQTLQHVFWDSLRRSCSIRQGFRRGRSYTIEIDSELDTKDDMSVEQVRKFIDDHLQPIAGGQKINAHDHQVEGVHHAMQNKRCLLLSPTASGKSLMIYALVRHCLEVLPKDKKILIVVPTTSLVTQMYSDFAEYSTHDPNFTAEKIVTLCLQDRTRLQMQE